MIDYPKIPHNAGNAELVHWLWQLAELINRLEERIEVLERAQNQDR